MDDKTFRDSVSAEIAADVAQEKAAATQVESGSAHHSDVPEPASPAAPLGDGVDGAALTPLGHDSELYRKLQKPVPQIWTRDGLAVLRRNEFFCECSNSEDAYFIADRLNAFDANLEARNMFQRMYLHGKEEDE